MTATNHAVTGALIAAVVDKPVLALPLAFLSHFMLDALPHLGADTRGRKFQYTLAFDVIMASSFLLSIVLLQPPGWLLLLAGAIVAMLPDVVWAPYYFLELQGKRQPTDPLDPFSQFHSRIQWGERPWGYLVEILWFAVALPAFFYFSVIP